MSDHAVREPFQRDAELAIINSVQTALASRLQCQEICDIVGEKIKHIFEAQVVSIAILNEEGTAFHEPYCIERDQRLPSSTFGVYGFRKHVVETGQSLLFNENLVQAKIEYGNPVIQGEAAKSAAFIPMIINDRVIGVASLQHLDLEFAFSDADVTLLKTVTNTLAVALENARLFDETQRLLQFSQDRAQELSMLNQMQTALANRKREQDIYEIVGDQIHEIFDAQVVDIALFDSVRDEFTFAYTIERKVRFPIMSMPNIGFRRHVIESQKMLLIDHDADAAGELYGNPMVVQGELSKSVLFVPLMDGKKAVGVISLQNLDREYAFCEADGILLSTLANSLTGALDNARLFDETQTLLKLTEDRADDLEVIGSIGRQITSHLEQASVIAALKQHVYELLDVQSFRLYRLDESQSMLELALGVEHGQSLGADRRKMEAGSPGERCLRAQTEVITAGNERRGSSLYAPLMAGAKTVGILRICAHPGTCYGERDAAILRSLCAYGAIALANSDALAALQQAQATIIQQEKMATLGQLVANVAHEINTPIGAIKSSGQSIVGALEHTLENLPRLFQLLDQPLQQLFMRLMRHTKNMVGMLNTREERAMTRTLTQSLELAGVVEPRDKAAMLVQLRAHEHGDEYLPLLMHPSSDFILKTGTGMAAIVSAADNINTAVERVAKIVFALKSYSRVDAEATFCPIDLADGIETVLTIYHNQIKHGVEVVRQYTPLPLLNGLPDELNQVWTNLIHNALQAMQGVGTLTIRISQSGNDAVVAISDTGCGIPPALRERIFEAFFTTKPAGEGSGLGLDIVKKIVAKHHGRISVDSEVGVGTTFSVALPLAGLH